MAILKDTVISGSLRATDTIYSTTAQLQILRAPTSSNGTDYGPGSANNILKSNGTSVYWTTLETNDIPSISITDKTTGTLPITRGGTGSVSSTGARTNLELGNAKIFYGVCSTAAGTTAKTVECSEFVAAELKAGAAILITFTNTNSGAKAELTLNVNSTGAKPIKKQYNTSQPSDLSSAGELQAGNTYLFVYNASFDSNAGAWVLITADYNNTYDLSQVSSASGASRQMETAANGGLGSHRYTLEMMTLNQKWSAISAVSGSTDANQGTAVAKVASTANFLLNSPILYTNTNLYTAPGGSNDLNGHTAVGMNLRYSIGTTASNVSLTYQKPVYLVGIVNSDNVTFKLDATKWWTQDLPTTNDGKIYIFLGMAYSSSSIYLYTNHPIYYHNGIRVMPYSPGALDNIINYNTSEQRTGGNWIDGKPLYRKTFEFTTGSARLSYLDISNLNAEFINAPLVTFNYTYNGINYWNSSYYYSSADFMRFYIDYSASQLVIDYGTGCSNVSAWITLEYTKTTD